MLGAAPETRGSIAAVVDAYRAHGLFQRWPIDYLPTHGDGGARRSAGLALEAHAAFRPDPARHRRARGAPAHQARAAIRRATARSSQRPWPRARRWSLQLHGSGLRAFSHGGPLMRAPARRSGVRCCFPCESLRAWVRSVRADGARGRACRIRWRRWPRLRSRRTPARPNLILFLGRLDAGQGHLRPARGGRGGALRRARRAPGLRRRRQPHRGGAPRRAPRHRRRGEVHRLGRPFRQARAARDAPRCSRCRRTAKRCRSGLPRRWRPACRWSPRQSAASRKSSTDGVSGFLVAPGDKATLDAPSAHAADRPHARRAPRQPRRARRARLRFAPERALAKLEEIYGALGLSALDGAQPAIAALRKAA